MPKKSWDKYKIKNPPAHIGWNPDLHSTLRRIVEETNKENGDGKYTGVGPIWLMDDFLEWGLESGTVTDLLAVGLLQSVNSGTGFAVTHKGIVQLTRWNDGKDGAHHESI